jgi:hypothetical protein
MIEKLGPKLAQKNEGQEKPGQRALQPLVFLALIGAEERIRTADLLITNQLLYQLSYLGILLIFIFNSDINYAHSVGPHP